MRSSREEARQRRETMRVREIQNCETGQAA